jgi:hypothetical protein
MVVVSKGAPSEVIGFLMAMGNTYGMLIITLLMGNGLVALPRRLWQLADDENELRRLYIMVSVAALSMFNIKQWHRNFFSIAILNCLDAHVISVTTIRILL